MCHFRQIICSSLLLWLKGITELRYSATNNYSTWLGTCISSLSNLSWSKIYITLNIFRTLPGLNILFRNLKKKKKKKKKKINIYIYLKKKKKNIYIYIYIYIYIFKFQKVRSLHSASWYIFISLISFAKLVHLYFSNVCFFRMYLYQQ